MPHIKTKVHYGREIREKQEYKKKAAEDTRAYAEMVRQQFKPTVSRRKMKEMKELMEK